MGCIQVRSQERRIRMFLEQIDPAHLAPELPGLL
jgi:hypothetical protein